MTLKHYIDSINLRYKKENATEHTYRGDLQNLIESLEPGIKATNEPKRQECGAPDYILTDKNDVPVGFIETKNIGDKDLEGTKKIGNKEQFDRYKASLSNIIFTDYLDFHWYIDGTLASKIKIGEITEKGIKPLTENFPSFEIFIKNFCTHIGQSITSSKKLAEMMANNARLLSEVIEKVLTSEETKNEDNTLKEQFEAFKKILIHDITPKDFADVYAQTIAYGMFAARLHDSNLKTFDRQKAAELIPKSNPFLRKLFGYIAGPDIDSRIKWIVDILAKIFLACNVEEILKNYGKSTQTEDPIIHFYETFLSEYDPNLRKERGVWYTPAPVVNFIVRAVDDILSTEFDLPEGLADSSKIKIQVGEPKKKSDIEIHKIQILDPATGTGTFLAEVVKHIHKNFKGQQGIWSNYVEKHLLPRLNGFELLMASYAMAHLQLDLLLKETGFKPTTNQRFSIYLTNSLEEHHPDADILFARWLSEEANEASKIKRDTPVMVVMGNPPYSGESANKGEWINKLMEDYKKEPGGKVKLNEKNPKWLNDDYVKFLRYGQHFIEKNGSGILAFINPHGFLDNPTFRGMRWNLLKTYDKIYTIDLHGNSKKKETAPDGGKDENVFDIMQGVSINIFIKTGKKKSEELGKVFHFDLFGKREIKYNFLNKNSLKTIPYRELPNIAPDYYFVNKNFSKKKKYDKGFSVHELFALNSVGVVTARDELFIAFNKKDLIKKVENEYNNSDKSYIENIAYRPFDNRYIYYDTKLIERSRIKVMQHFLKGENLGLVFKLGNSELNSVSAMITNKITDFRSWSRSGMQGGDYIAPLYLYPDTSTLSAKHALNAGILVFESGGGDKKIYENKRTPNLNKEIVNQIAENLGLTFTPEKENKKNTFALSLGAKVSFAPINILDYIYAVLHSPTYRKKYKEFLKIDFPRVPYPKDKDTFWKLVNLGGEIRLLHLLESKKLEKFKTKYPIDGDNLVGKIFFEKKTETSGRIFINHDKSTAKESGKLQYFDNVPEVAWNFYIGGYQPAQKWLKDRKDRKLDYDDITHYQKIIQALTETDRLMREIDKIEVE